MRIHIDDDFDLEKIADSGQCFRACRDEGSRFRFIFGDHLLYIEDLGEGFFDLSCEESDWLNIWKPYFDMDSNYAKIRSLASDPFMKQAAEAGKGIRILRQDPWETLISFIISQRKSIPAIRGCVEALSSRFGKPLASVKVHPGISGLRGKSGSASPLPSAPVFSETPGSGKSSYSEKGIPSEMKIFAFPSVEELSTATEDELNRCRLGYRTPYIMDAVRRVRSGEINLSEIASLSDEDLLNKLMTIHGVGIKVASCVALFAYGRKGVAPVDTWIRKMIDTHYSGINPFPSYGSAAGVMQQYVFFSATQVSK